MRFSKWIFRCAIVCLAFSACKKEISTSITNEVQDPPKSWDDMSALVAKDVAEKLNNISFRRMLKHEVSLRFDGDANILLSSMIDRIPKYLAYESAEKATSRGNTTIQPKNQELIANLDFTMLANAAKAFPQMQIAVQTNVENWDPINFVPSVVYLPSTFDEGVSKTVPGFDSNKQPIEVDAIQEPNLNYVVISLNERTTMRNGKLTFTSSNCPVEPIISSASYDLSHPTAIVLPPDDCNGGGTGGGGTSTHPQYTGTGQDGILPTLIERKVGTYISSKPGGGFYTLAPVGSFNGTLVYRTNNRHEKMRFIKCEDLGAIEGWPSGNLEIRMHVFEQDIRNPSDNLQIFKEVFTPRRDDIRSKWYDTRGVTMHLWDYQGTGTKAGFAYYEYDAVVVPNETVASIGEIAVDLLAITSVIATGTANQLALYGNIRKSVGTGIRGLKKKNGMSEYIGKDDYSIFNNQDEFYHEPGKTTFRTWPDL